MQQQIDALSEAVERLRAVRTCVCHTECQWHGNPHDYWAFRGDSGSWYLLPLARMLLVPNADCLMTVGPIKMKDNWTPVRVRDLMIDGREVTVCPRHNIIDPGKFEGEMPHAVRDYSAIPDEMYGSAWRVKHRYYHERDDGFVDEIGKTTFESFIPPESCPEDCDHSDYRVCAKIWEDEVAF